MNQQQPIEHILHVLVQNPETTIFKGDAFAVTSVNNKGIFDVLPLHANFICMIKDSLTIHVDEKKITKIPLERGILKVFENNVEIFLGIETIK